jgi:hypothetical protein
VVIFRSFSCYETKRSHHKAHKEHKGRTKINLESRAIVDIHYNLRLAACYSEAQTRDTNISMEALKLH